ncbi:MAG: hypothetical protein OQK76_01010 [Gammaproteobacteria bacterium]|nr:hypothetical protein [Gammaproteobacteria bacterium]MCW8909175.1 hypothetical protein [Gammaproteobacteria bacterium]MCW9005691.1 hypothetical protein [Gammaproteobacteria bacterium]MCW9055272.1 hypothetical protein [Gammaproteobacteria bacterium]
MKLSIKTNLIWLLSGPVFALTLSFANWFVIDYFTPGKLNEISTLITAYPLGLVMSLLTPWGWLMYGGLLLMNTRKSRSGLYCTLGGALILGLFWPIWSTDMVSV